MSQPDMRCRDARIKQPYILNPPCLLIRIRSVIDHGRMLRNMSQLTNSWAIAYSEVSK